MIAYVAITALLSLTGSIESAEKLRHPDCVYQLRSDAAMWVRNDKKAFGTQKAIRLFRAAVWKVRRQFKNTHRVPVGNLSYRGGGPIKPHRSHKDGRDVDAGYYFKDGRFRKWFGKPKQAHLDVARQWALFKHLINTGEVEFIFVDYRLQRALHRYALKHGETKRSLRRLMQWPRHWRSRRGVIRYERGHDDHYHVRFKR